MHTHRWKNKIVDPKQLPEIVATLKRAGRKIATLNGSFDLMHAGHLYIISEAAKVADILIVALNTDKSIQQYKSPDRPIIPLNYRMEMMAALEFVDYVTWFDETDPRKFLEAIKPDIHVNGAEYGQHCIEADTVKANGGALHLVDRIPGLSTSEVLTKIAQLKSRD
jgi:rfaE bifunctional protein nucleotidyltransferase chain/domain